MKSPVVIQSLDTQIQNMLHDSDEFFEIPLKQSKEEDNI